MRRVEAAFALTLLVLVCVCVPLAHAGWSQSGGGQAGTGGITLPAGDLSGTGSTNTNPTVSNLTGSGAITTVSASTLQWLNSVSNPAIGQQNESLTTKAADFLIQPQQSAHAVDQGGGNLLANLQVPAGAGAHATFQVQEAGLGYVFLGRNPTGGTQGWAWFGQVTPSATNYAFVSDGATATVFNSGGGNVYFRISGSAAMGTYTANGLELFSETTAFGGGTGVLGVANASVVPTSNPSGGLVEYASAGGGFARGSGGAVQQVSAAGVGTINSQAMQTLEELYAIEVTATTATTFATIAVTSAHCDTFTAFWNAKVKNSGANVQSNQTTCSACNNAGTVTSTAAVNAYASNQTIGTLCTSGTPAITCTASGSNELLQVSGCANASGVDYQINVSTNVN